MTIAFDPAGRLKAPSQEELVMADASSAVIVLDCGTLEDGGPYWVYVAIKPSKYKEFMRLACDSQPMRIKDFGTILKYGFDKQVPGAVKETMRQDYGFDDSYLAMLATHVRKARIEFLQEEEGKRLSEIVAMLKKKDR